MIKILYAASNNQNAKIQLSRFLDAIYDKPYHIKIAAYKKSSPKNVNIDWTLDSLLNIYKPDHFSLENDNLKIYYEQIKSFNPDLIISDLEYFTSYIANVLNIKLWQCSSSIINYALNNDYKYNLGIFKMYAYIFNRNPINTQRIINILDGSERNFIYSHFGDAVDTPEIKNNFEWIRPYHTIGKDYIPCQHNIVAATVNNNKKIFKCLKKYSDTIIFMPFINEKYYNIQTKDISNEEEYFCNLKNSNLFINEGQSSFLADAFYNKKYSVVLTDFNDPECIINSTISERLNLSTIIYNESNDISGYLNLPIINNLNNKVKFLHEHIEDL